LRVPNIIHTDGGMLTPDTPYARIKQQIAEAVAANPAGGLVFHFHGGLVGYSQGEGIAKSLDPVYRDGGAIPFFALWESDFLSTIQGGLVELTKDSNFCQLWKWALYFVRRKSLQTRSDRRAQTLPPVKLTSVAATVRACLQRARPHAKRPPRPRQFVVPAGITKLTAAEKRILKAEFDADSEVTAIKRRSAKAAASLWTTALLVAGRTLLRFIRDRDHGPHATIMEELVRVTVLGPLGRGVWTEMKKFTKDAFKAGERTYGGTAILAALESAVPAGSAPPKLTLVGHSTGAIYIANFLVAARARLPKWEFDVVFLAPAITCLEMDRSMLSGAARASMRNYRSFGMEDKLESADPVLASIPWLYPSSLLYVVSGLLEFEDDAPLVGMQRFYDAKRYPPGKFPRTAKVRAFRSLTPSATVWSETGIAQAGRQSASRSHVDFDNLKDDALTMRSVQHILANGF
jgi:hypothetical protein